MSRPFSELVEFRVCRAGHEQRRPKNVPKGAKCLFGPCGKTLVPRRVKNARAAGIESEPESPVPSETA